MNKPYFIETIKVVDGKFQNLSYHMDRMNNTMISFFNTTMFVELWIGDIPEELRTGITKCRITYSHCDIKVEYERYKYRKIDSLKLVNDSTIHYFYKYANRDSLNSLLCQRATCDDILIVNNDHITDTSFSNVVLKKSSNLYTPSTYLLAGTKRSLLLEKGIIKEAEIKVSDLKNYEALLLINAMIDLDDNQCIDISNIV